MARVRVHACITHARAVACSSWARTFGPRALLSMMTFYYDDDIFLMIFDPVNQSTPHGLAHGLVHILIKIMINTRVCLRTRVKDRTRTHVS